MLKLGGISAVVLVAALAGAVLGEDATHTTNQDTLTSPRRVPSNPALSQEEREKAEAIPAPGGLTKPASGGETDTAARVGDGALTLVDAEGIAVASHPLLREAEGRVRAAQGNWVQVGLAPNPEIGYSGTEIGNDGRAGQQGGFFAQEYVTGGKLDLNRSVALREKMQAEQRFQIARLQVVTTVRKYYFEAVAAERAVTLTHQLSEIAAQSVDASQKRLERQDVPKTTLLQSQIESQSAEMQEQQAKERLAAARRRLATVLGMCDAESLKLEDVLARPLPELDFCIIRERILSDSPEVIELRFAVDRARWAVERASAGRKPNVNVQAGVQYDNATEDPIANVQVSLPVPVFDRNQGAITQASGELVAAQAALEARQLALQERLAVAMRDYITASERVSKYREKILPAAEETLGLINMGYQQGQLEYMQVLSVQQTYASKNLSYLQDLETAWQQWAEIDGFLVGEVSPTSIDRSEKRPENRESWQWPLR